MKSEYIRGRERTVEKWGEGGGRSAAKGYRSSVQFFMCQMIFK